jgi:hypothetical protein
MWNWYEWDNAELFEIWHSNFIIGSNDKYGWCDAKGKIIINPQFDYVKPFTGNKLAPIRQDSKWGFINKEGKIEINPQFDYVTPFNHGVAFAYSDEQWGIIDESGKYVANPQFKIFYNFIAEPLFSDKLPYGNVESDFFDVDAAFVDIGIFFEHVRYIK